MKEALFLALCLIVGQATEANDQLVTISGKTPEARIEFLKKIQNEAEELGDLEYRNKYYSRALSDPSPVVRSYAAYGLRGSQYIVQLIRVITTDPNQDVRSSAAIGLGHWLTDNGTETCEDAQIVETQLQELFKALRDPEISQYIIEILGASFSGEMPLPCCMSNVNKTSVASELKSILKNQSADRWGYDAANEALENISNCQTNEQ